MIDFYIPTCTSDKPGGAPSATGHTFPYRPSQSPVRVTCGAALLKEGLNGR